MPFSPVVIDAVQPTGRELRPLTRGWGRLHLLNTVVVLAPILGLVGLGLTTLGEGFDSVPREAVAFWLIGPTLVWVIAYRFLMREHVRLARAAPFNSGAWRWSIGETGLACDRSPDSSFTSWEAMRDVLEEKDRFIFLITPAASPVLPKRLLSPDQSTALRAILAEVRRTGRLRAGVD